MRQSRTPVRWQPQGWARWRCPESKGHTCPPCPFRNPLGSFGWLSRRQALPWGLEFILTFVLVELDWRREQFHWFLWAKRPEEIATQCLLLVLPAWLGRLLKLVEKLLHLLPFDDSPEVLESVQKVLGKPLGNPLGMIPLWLQETTRKSSVVWCGQVKLTKWKKN